VEQETIEKSAYASKEVPCGHLLMVSTSVVDQHCFQCASESRNLGQCESGSRDVITKMCTILVRKKSALYFSLGLHERRPSYRRSLQPSIENIQHFQIAHFKLFCADL
jgi:hypothetical protein